MLYPQLLTFNSVGDNSIQQQGETFVFTTGDESSVRVQLQEIPLGNYKLLFDYNKQQEGCFFSLWQRQTPLTDWINSYANTTERVKHQYFSDLSLTPLNHTITVRFKADGNKKFF